ncbi:uncharacterized protein EI97DRAFT_91915 [Westerdykella ornata]|uniref:Uncharacterized protein n=1 Tax=Westerdykella ornata TaxID=318751 RepID=A0A6A6JE96_WESOR|nr:uncharacterized protein EI97DRAFT_91915 [Westerdykella ornata]KAF2274881.1 hypothetical protein EI97DRAFT_91915 [Westerdykella ornata]
MLCLAHYGSLYVMISNGVITIVITSCRNHAKSTFWPLRKCPISLMRSQSFRDLRPLKYINLLPSSAGATPPTTFFYRPKNGSDVEMSVLLLIRTS